MSANGRIITATGAIACGHRPILVARAYPGRVTLKWVNPDTKCNAEAIVPVTVSVTLASPLGYRKLVQASDGAPIPYHVQRQGNGS
ncbi:MAG: hypothetical protein ACYCVZ_06310 [Streptosporangiaceae bacterium]